MPATRAFPFIYRRCIRGVDEDTRLEIDVLLGDEEADRQMQQRRREAIAAMGGVIA